MANQTTISKYLSDGRPVLILDTSKTLAITDCGVVQNVIADGITITLPATVVGYTYTIRNAGVPKTSGPAGTGDDGSIAVTIAPNASDLVAGGTWTAADNKSIVNTKVTAKVGDELQLVADGVNGWMVVKQIGIWAKTA